MSAKDHQKAPYEQKAVAPKVFPPGEREEVTRQG
jgi:hypothetical protein